MRRPEQLEKELSVLTARFVALEALTLELALFAHSNYDVPESHRKLIAQKMETLQYARMDN